MVKIIVMYLATAANKAKFCD